MSQVRSVRVATSPIAVRIADVHGRLVNISATGALMQVNQSLAPQRECPIFLSVDWEPVTLRGRVIRADGARNMPSRLRSPQSRPKRKKR
jgi:hypothetical protein